jgi:hypothetical protein
MRELVVLGVASRELAEEARRRRSRAAIEALAPLGPGVLRTNLDPAAEQRLLAAFTENRSSAGLDVAVPTSLGVPTPHSAVEEARNRGHASVFLARAAAADAHPRRFRLCRPVSCLTRR